MPARRRDLPLWLRLSNRRLRSPEGRLAPLALVSIAVSVMLATGLEMASRSAERHLSVTAEAVAGLAEIEVVAGEVGLQEHVLEIVRATPGVHAASPLVSGKVRLIHHPFALNVIGLDFLAEEDVRQTQIERNGLTIRDPLRLLASPDSVVVTESLLERLGLIDRYRGGQLVEIPVRSGERTINLKVQGALRPTGIAAAYSGQVAVMDLFAAQALVAREGLFDRIDVVIERENDASSVISRLSARLDGIATVQRSSARSGIAEDMLEVVRRSALIIAGAAAVVSCLLTYATTSQWVERQQRQLATLRAVGMEARRVQYMILAEVLVLSAVGTALGIGLGIALSPPLLSVLSEFVRVVGAEQFHATTFQQSTFLLALLVGLLSGIAGGVIPARRAAQRFTLDSTDARPGRGSSPRLLSGIGWLGVVAVVCLVSLGDAIPVAAIPRVASVLLIGALSLLALSPSLLRLLQTPLRWCEGIRPSLSHLATRFLRERPLTFAVAVSAVSTLVAVLVAVFLLIETIQSAMVRWSEARMTGNPIWIFATPIASPAWNELLSPTTMELIRSAPGVAAVSEQYRIIPSVLVRGETVPISAIDIKASMIRGHIASVGQSSSELSLSLLDGDISVSPGFAIAFGLSQGDFLPLDTPKGRREFRIAGLHEDFGEKNGSILMDIRTFDEFWHRSGATAALVWTDGPEDRLIEEIQARVGARQDLFFLHAPQIVARNREITQVFTGTLYVLGAFISLLGTVGVATLLAGVVAERRREFALLRAAGAEPRQLVELVLADAVVLGVLGSASGLLLGLAAAGPAADVPREVYGWILEQKWFALELPFVVLGGLFATVAGAIFPAQMAYRTPPDGVLGPD